MMKIDSNPSVANTYTTNYINPRICVNWDVFGVFFLFYSQFDHRKQYMNILHCPRNTCEATQSRNFKATVKYSQVTAKTLITLF